MIKATNATNRAFVRPRLLTTPRYACTNQLHMLQLVVSNGRHVIKLTSTGSHALCAPSSALLMAKAVHCMHARRYVLFRALVLYFNRNHICEKGN